MMGTLLIHEALELGPVGLRLLLGQDVKPLPWGIRAGVRVHLTPPFFDDQAPPLAHHLRSLRLPAAPARR